MFCTAITCVIADEGSRAEMSYIYGLFIFPCYVKSSTLFLLILTPIAMRLYKIITDIIALKACLVQPFHAVLSTMF